MTQLKDALDGIKEKLRRPGTLNEATTKTALIQPLISALGWDVSDPNEVVLEYRAKSSDNPVDFALFLFGVLVLFIEAKARDRSTTDAKFATQIMSYAVQAGVKWVVITNGDEYRIYNTHAAVPLEQKLLQSVRISDGTNNAEAILESLSKDSLIGKRLDVLWGTHFGGRKLLETLQALFDSSSPDRDLVQLIAARSGLSQEDVSTALSNLDARFQPREGVAHPERLAVIATSGTKSNTLRLDELRTDHVPIAFSILGAAKVDLDPTENKPFTQLFIQLASCLDEMEKLPHGEFHPNPKHAAIITNEPKSGATRPLSDGRHLNIRHTQKQFLDCTIDLAKWAGLEARDLRVWIKQAD